ncbi:hypothetical protein BC939DRAFT_475287 [Gamsiella multidivaricata]|uniref:uncharacterized protein n=1 Tax=Gamsiella multidivaricata TaxID=101098 RepID=UPI00221F345A|nr:uncharacterized protein BC939DRAFT_475287 [Gamsiella multidivaricata]KAI7827396.1 hypothetical protein BC939DRAFT_475287 [Gamsiella multidivaricata]
MQMETFPADIYATSASPYHPWPPGGSPLPCQHGSEKGLGCAQCMRSYASSHDTAGPIRYLLEDDDEEENDFLDDDISKTAENQLETVLISTAEVPENIAKEQGEGVLEQEEGVLEPQNNEAVSGGDSDIAIHLKQDTDVAPSLPLIELIFDDTLYELFYSSSKAFKASHVATSARGTLLFANNSSLLDEPLLVLFTHLRKDLLEPRYGADSAYYELGMVFKGLEDLWLLEHEGAASKCSLVKLVHLYMDASETQGQEMLLEPFRIELSIQETFLSHLSRLGNRRETKAQSISHAVAEDDITDLAEPALASMVHSTLEQYFFGAKLDDSSILTSSRPYLLDVVAAVDRQNESLNSDQVILADTGMSEEGARIEDAVNSGNDIRVHIDENIDVSEIDVDSLACFDDKAYEEDYESGEEDEHGSPSPTARSPKRSIEEMINLLGDDLVNELSPDREVSKKHRADA